MHFLFVENEGNCVWVFPFLNQTLWCINSLYRVVAKPVSQRTAGSHTQSPKRPLKFTDSALFSFAQDGSQLAWNCKIGCVLDALKVLI